MMTIEIIRQMTIENLLLCHILKIYQSSYAERSKTQNIQWDLNCFNRRLNKLIKVQKDTTKSLNSNNVIYKIRCNDCNASYVDKEAVRNKN